MSLRFINELLAPVTDLESGTKAPLSKEGIIEILNEEDDEVIPLDDDKKKEKTKEDDKEEKVTEEKEEEPNELELLEQELEEPTEEQLELVTPVRRQEILKKYPSVFKDFPALEKAYYREQQFTELLPTIDDAKKAVEDSQTLGNLEKDLMGGETEKLLLAVKNENSQAFNKIVDNYMATLFKVDKEAHNHVIGNTIKHTIVAMVQEGRKSNNEALQSAAQILNQFIFGSSDYEPPTKLSKDDKVNNENDEVTNERQQWLQEKFDTAKDDLSSRVSNSIKATIDQNIDPKNSMSDYIKKNATREALETVNNLIEKDSRFKIIIDKLWDNAKSKNFNKESTDRIRSAFLSKAKTLLPAVIKSARNEALKGTGKRVQNDSNEPDEKEESSTTTRRASTPQTHERGKEKVTGKPRGMSTYDFLKSDD